jgi:CRP-like cAMP-binding protein
MPDATSAITRVNEADDDVRSEDVFLHLAGEGIAALPDWPQVERARRTRSLRRGESLFVAGDAGAHVHVVNGGVIRMVYDTRDGDGWIKGFAEAGTCFASLTALEDGGVASYSAFAETDARVDRIDFALLAGLAARHPAWQRVMTQAFRIYGQRKEQREMELLTLSAEERYLRFLQRHPALAGLLRQRDIASYVRVTPVALSRIRTRLIREGRIAPADNT